LHYDNTLLRDSKVSEVNITCLALNNSAGFIEFKVWILNSSKFLEARESASFEVAKTARAEVNPKFDKINFICEDSRHSLYDSLHHQFNNGRIHPKQR